MKKNTSIKSEKNISTLIFKIICCAILVLYTLTLIISFGWGALNSVKSPLFYEIDSLLFNRRGVWQASVFSFKNYLDAINNFLVEVKSGAGSVKVNFGDMALNSVIYAFICSLLQTSACCFMAYVVARYSLKASKVIYFIVILAMILPIVGSLPSEVQMLNNLHLYDTFFGSFLLSFNFLGVHFLVFHASFTSIPKDYTEAAMLDGAGHWRIFLNVILPLVRNVFLTILLLKFIVYWNDYQTPLVYMPSFPTLAYGLHRFNFASGSVSSVPHKLAGCFLVFLPIFILFIIMHDKLIGNLSMGGIKG